METEELKDHLLANFNDGGTWEDAEALSLTKHGALDVAEYFYNLGCQTSPTLQNKSVEEVVDIAIANLIFSGLSIAQMEKIPKWLLENIEKNKSDFKSTINQTSQERELDILEIHLNKQMEGYTNVSLASIYNYIDQRREALTNPNKD